MLFSEEDEDAHIFYVENVLPLYDKLLYDGADEVRTACALIFHELIKIFGDMKSREYLTQYFFKLLDDASYEVLGAFLTNIEISANVLIS